MIKIALCEDNIIQLNNINALCKKILDSYLKNYILNTFTCGEDLINTNEKFDIYLLDIELNKLSGIQTAKIIKEQYSNSIIIFITAIKDYVFEAFDVHAFNYILKPVDPGRFNTILLSAIDKITKQNKFIIAKFNGSTKKIMLDDIMYIESLQRKINVHTTYDNIEYYYKLSDIEKELTENNFFRCHKSFLVNLHFVYSYTNNSIVLKNKEEIFLSKYKYVDFSKAFMYYIKNGES